MNKKLYQKLNMEIEVLFFASYREKAGVKSCTFEISPGSNLKGLIDKIVQKFPKLHSDPSKIVAAINEEFSDQSQILSEGDIVALIPPVSGGSK
tara:strand:- start:146 stop:427 length:282 start_codon:yes stop_codon:yes gene_type:complete